MIGRRRLIALAVAVVTSLQLVSAQDPPAQSRESLLATARRALISGQAGAALRTLDPWLARFPQDREIVELAISASLAQDDSSRAHAIYDSFVQAADAEDARLLKPIAVRELRKLVAGAVHDPRLRTEILERLAVSGDASAVSDLRQSETLTRQTLLDDTALTRLGDEAAKRRIEAALSSPDFADKTPVAEAIRRAGDPKQAALLVPLLTHQDAYTRMAAVEGIGALGYTDGIEALRLLLKDPTSDVRRKAALALTRLGDSAGRALVATMLRSPVADVRLMALDADPSITGAARGLIIRPILTDPDPLVRVMAAEMLARDEPDEARPYLVALLKDPDSTPRRLAGRALESLQPPDITLFRRLMADREPWVRMYGAGGVLKAAGVSPPR